MKKICIILILLLLNNCNGYKPIFSGDIVNFYIGEIFNENNNKLTKKIIKKLNPYTTKSDKKKNEYEYKFVVRGKNYIKRLER